MEITAMESVPARDGRPVDMVFWPPIGAVNGQYWACARRGHIIAEGPREKLLGRLLLCLCGCLNAAR